MAELLSNQLYRDDYYAVRIEHGILRLERTATPYPTIEAMNAAYRQLAVAVRDAGVKRILLDLSKGPPGRNDDAFEQASSQWRRQLAAEADRVAILMRSVAGKLQSQRLAKNEGRSANNIFLDEKEALAFLSG